MSENPDLYSSETFAVLTKNWGHPYSRDLVIEMRKRTDGKTGETKTEWECMPLGRGHGKTFSTLEALDEDILKRQKAREAWAKIIDQEEKESLRVTIDQVDPPKDS